MKDSHYRLIFAVIISIPIMFLIGGCAIGVKPRSYDVPSEDDAHYEESARDYYYNTGTPTNIHHYDPNYDPWTMGTYYQYYSGSPRSSINSGSSNTSSTRRENTKPAVKDRNSTSVSQPKAPSNPRSSLRKDREANKRTNSESRSSSVTQQKVKRSSKRGTTQTSRKTQSTDGSNTKQKKTRTPTSQQKTRREPVKSESEKEDKEEN